MIARQGSGARETFTVRKQSFGVGVERTFPVHSPKIERLEVVARGDVRRAKLYYLRGRVGKRARVAERRWGIEDELVIAEPRSRRRSTPRASPRSEAEAEVAERRGGARGARRGRGDAGRRRRPRRPPTSEASRRRPRQPEPRSEAGAEARGRGLPTRRRADPEADNGRGRARRARRHRRARDRAGARDPGLRRQAVPDPLGVDGADARRRPAGARQPLHLPLQDPAIGDIVVFHPPQGPTAAGGECGARDQARSEACPRADPAGGDINFIKRIVAGPGDTLCDPERPSGRQRARPHRRLHQALPRRSSCNLPKNDHHPARPLLHDGRQPWGERRQPLLGTRPARLDHRQGLLHLLAAGPDRVPLAATEIAVFAG